MSKNRNINDLDPIFWLKARNFFADERIKELGVILDEWLRTTKRQQELYKQGRTKPWSIVTNCDGIRYKSNHQHWLAFDIFFLNSNWWASWSRPFEVWREVGNIANTYGIDWGYDIWQADKPHFQDNFKKNNMSKKNKKTVDAVIAINSLAWHSLEGNKKNEIQKILAKHNDELRQLK